jgi:hypothetical protein
MRAKEIVFCLLVKGHRVAPSMALVNDCALWLAKPARSASTLRSALHAAHHELLKHMPYLKRVQALPGPLTRSIAILQGAGWAMAGGWWRWLVPCPGGTRILDLRTDEVLPLRHAIRDAIRHQQLTNLSIRRPETFDGVQAGIDFDATRAWLMERTHEGLPRALLRGLLAGATWTAKRA